MKAAELLERSGADHVELLTERQELLRFGGGRITYQHSEEKLTVRARRGDAWVTLAKADPDAIHTHLGNANAGTVVLVGEEPRVAATAFAATEQATADDRVALYQRYSEGAPDLGGSIAHTVVEQSIANTAGLDRNEKRTRALVQLIATENGYSSYARALHRDAAQLDDLSHVVEALEPLPVRELAPGRYRALLEPQAMVTLAATLGQVAFHPVDGAFANRLGEQVLGENVTIIDDGGDADGMPTSFDCLGTAKARVPLVERGVVAGVITRETGHAVPPAWRFGGGPSPSHLFLAAGDASTDDLRAACDTGLLIQRVDYVRVVHPKQTVVTGSTRDATRWLENGRVVARLPQFRFTLRLDELFSSLEVLGARRERGELPFMESIAAPGAVVAALPVDVVTG